jgi:hypothetical protein
MNNLRKIARGGFLVVLAGWMAGCIVTPTEGYYDRDHHRYYHEHGWHDCGEHNDYCR